MNETAIENPDTVVPRLEQNSCFSRPWRVVTRNADYSSGMKYKQFREKDKAIKYLERQRFKKARLAARWAWKVVQA